MINAGRIKVKRRLAGALIALTLLIAFAKPAFAVEGALGRPISGAGINPYAGLVPPAPGVIVGVGEEYYQGSIGGGTTVPINALLTVGIDMKVSFTPISLTYIWNTSLPQWNFASGFALPVTWLQARAAVTLGPLSGHVNQSEFGLFDIPFTPIVASYHLSKTDHLAFNFTFWAPTGDYDQNRLANLSLNNWTFIPSVAYTKIYPEPDIELSGMCSMEFYTENPDTHYQNGIISDLEGTAIKRFQNGAGIGVIGSWIDQLTDDSGPKADRLNGFRGRAFGAGPIVTFSKEIGKQHFDFNARWVHEFENQNRIEGISSPSARASSSES